MSIIFISLYRRKLVYNFLILFEKNSNQNFHDYGEELADETTFRKSQSGVVHGLIIYAFRFT